MALTSAVIPQPSVKTSMAPEAHPSTAFDIDGLSETSTLTPTPSTASSSAPLETMQHPMQTPASPAPPKTTQHSKQTPLSTPPTKYSVQRMQHLRDDFLGVYLPAPPERSQTHPSEGKKSIPKVSSKVSWIVLPVATPSNSACSRHHVLHPSCWKDSAWQEYR